MADFLESLGQGLRGAGAILSSPVYEQQNREQNMMLAEMQRRRAELARALVSGIESGAVDKNSEQVQIALKRLGVPADAFGPSPVAQAQTLRLKQEQEATQFWKQYMDSMGGDKDTGGMSGGLRDSTLLQAAATNPVLAERLKTISDLRKSMRPTLPSGARINLENATPESRKKFASTGDWSVLEFQKPDKQQNKSEFQKLLDEYEAPETSVERKAMIKKRLDRMDATPRTSINLGLLTQQQLAKQGTEEPLSVMKKYGFSDRGAELAAYNKMFNNKYPPGLAQQARNAAIDNYAAKLASDAGLDMATLATLPAQKKADAQALMKRTQIIASMEGTFSSFENNMDTWEQIAAGVAPKLAGKLDKSVIDSFSKINFTDSMTANDIKNAIAKQFNDPSTVAYLTATMTVAMDYARIISSQGGVSGARVTDSARTEAMKMIPAGVNDQARKSLRATLTADANGQLQGQVKAAERLRKNLGVVNPANAQQPGVTDTPTPTPKPKFEEGKVYVDSKGRKAKYVNGKWEEVE